MPVYVKHLAHLSIRDLQKISRETIGALPGPVRRFDTIFLTHVSLVQGLFDLLAKFAEPICARSLGHVNIFGPPETVAWNRMQIAGLICCRFFRHAVCHQCCLARLFGLKGVDQDLGGRAG